MVTVCRKCGVPGYTNSLIYCINCHVAAEHSYCLGRGKEDTWSYYSKRRKRDAWSCEDCKQKIPEVSSFNKLSSNVCKATSPEQHCNLHVKDACEPARSMGDPFEVKDENEGLHSCSEKIEGNQCMKTRRRKLVLTDVDDCEGEYEFMNCSQPAGLMGDPFVVNDENEEGLHSCSEKIEGNQCIKKQCWKLVLTDVDECVRESKFVNCGHRSTDKKISNFSAAPFSNSGVTDQAAGSLQAVLFSAEAQVTTTVPGINCGLSSISCDQQPDGCNTYARPIFYPAWRGSFAIHNCNHVNIVAHYSDKACEKVYEGVKMLSPTLDVKKLPRADAWPKSFQESPPTDDNIGLYFFPRSERDETLSSRLINDLDDRGQALKVTLDKVELLIFSSRLLPKLHERFHDKFYLWGVFRGRKDPLLQSPVDDQIHKNGLVKDREEVCGLSPTHIEAAPPNSYEGDMVVKDGEELKLFPLGAENIAVMAMMGGAGRLDLELGLGRPVDGTNEKSLGCKSHGAGATEGVFLSLDKVIM